jgi:hypothetical protein
LIFVPTTRSNISRLLGTTLVVAALGFGISACGGGDDEETPAPTATTTTTEETVALTKDDLISQGDDVCAEANAALGSIASSTADDTTKSSQVSDIYDGIAQQLGDLGTPTDGDPPTDVISTAGDLANGTGTVEEFTAAAEEYGFTDCAQAPEATSYPSDSTSTESSTGTAPTETYTPPATETAPETTTPAPTTPTSPSTGGGVAPTPPSTGGGTSTGGSSGGTSSGGIGPG